MERSRANGSTKSQRDGRTNNLRGFKLYTTSVLIMEGGLGNTIMGASPFFSYYTTMAPPKSSCERCRYKHHFCHRSRPDVACDICLEVGLEDQCGRSLRIASVGCPNIIPAKGIAAPLTHVSADFVKVQSLSKPLVSQAFFEAIAVAEDGIRDTLEKLAASAKTKGEAQIVAVTKSQIQAALFVNRKRLESLKGYAWSETDAGGIEKIESTWPTSDLVNNESFAYYGWISEA